MPDLNLIHRARIPSGAAAGSLPAVVMVHGRLGNETVMSIFERTVPPGAGILSVRAPLAADGGYDWYQDVSDAASFQHGLDALREFVAGVPGVYPVNPERIALMGFSQGAAMCYSMLLGEPGLVAAVAGLAGFLPELAQQWVQPHRLAGKRVFISHGLEDDTVPVEDARRARAALASAGAELAYHEYATGHRVNAQGMRDLTAWLADTIGQAPPFDSAQDESFGSPAIRSTEGSQSEKAPE